MILWILRNFLDIGKEIWFANIWFDMRLDLWDQHKSLCKSLKTSKGIEYWRNVFWLYIISFSKSGTCYFRLYTSIFATCRCSPKAQLQRCNTKVESRLSLCLRNTSNIVLQAVYVILKLLLVNMKVKEITGPSNFRRF